MRVLAWPAMDGNPYLAHFTREIEARGCTSSWPSPKGLPHPRSDDWVHMHWPGARLMSPQRAVYRWRIAKLKLWLRFHRARGVRIAWTAHNLYPHDDPHPDLGHAGRRALLASVDHVFVHFAAAEAAVRSAFDYRGPVTVIPHGHYIEDYGELADPPDARRQLGLPPEGLVVLMLGQIRPYKWVVDGVRGFMQVAGREDRLLIAGHARPSVERELAFAGSDPRVIIQRGVVPSERVSLYHAAASCFLVAHRSFFTSGSAVMALSLGCPVVGPPLNHLATFGDEPRLFRISAGADGIARGLERVRARGSIDRRAIVAWAREHLDWSIAGERAAAVFLSRTSGAARA
jgi:beta-1,4-mannosyltransferase